MTCCSDCGRQIDKTWRGYCNPCYKRNVWRPMGTEALERDREASRRWKREHLGQPGKPRREAA